MAPRPACRESFTRFGSAFAGYCFAMVTAPPLAAQTYGPPAPPPPASAADEALAKAKELVDPIKRCKPAAAGEIVVCGAGTEEGRLTPEERAIAGVGRSTKNGIPDAPKINPTVLDKLPYNWVPLGKRYPPGPEYNPLYEMAKRATDPETGVPPPEPEP